MQLYKTIKTNKVCYTSLAILSSTHLQPSPCPKRVPYFPTIPVTSNVTFRKWARLFHFKTQGVVHGLNSSILNLSILIFFFNRQEGLTPSSKVSKTCSLGNLRCGKWNCGAAKTLLSLSIRYISFSFKISIMYLEKKRRSTEMNCCEHGSIMLKKVACKQALLEIVRVISHLRATC